MANMRKFSRTGQKLRSSYCLNRMCIAVSAIFFSSIWSAVFQCGAGVSRKFKIDKSRNCRRLELYGIVYSGW